MKVSLSSGFAFESSIESCRVGFFYVADDATEGQSIFMPRVIAFMFSWSDADVLPQKGLSSGKPCAVKRAS